MRRDDRGSWGEMGTAEDGNIWRVEIAGGWGSWGLGTAGRLRTAGDWEQLGHGDS